MASPYLEVKGHSRTVSKVIFITTQEIFSMSLDSTAKLWDINKTVCVNNYVGHVHHTYFVGADVTDDYIVMGGEDSSLRVYCKRNFNYIAYKRLSCHHCFVCGCAWLNSLSSNTLRSTC
jgi:WD40 repeat protein